MKVWQAFLGIEAVLILVAVATVLTPSKTGGRARAAELFFENPGFLHEALVWFVAGNILVALLGVIVVISVRRSNRRKRSR
jgi:hypothetical protein